MSERMTMGDATDQMNKIRASLKDQVHQIRASDNYTSGGRKAEIAKAVLAHRKQVDGLRTHFSAPTNDATRARLVGKLFGLPANADASTVMSYRDAVDRASKLTRVEDATAALKTAIEMGDTAMARAVAGYAHGKKWRSVTEGYAEAAGLGNDLDELKALPGGGLLNTAMTALFSLGAMPPEVQEGLGGRDVSDEHLRQLADE